MTAEMMTRRLHPLTVDECLRLLESRSVGRIAFVDDGDPQVLPVNYRVHEGAIVFRTHYGPLLDAVHLSPGAFEGRRDRPRLPHRLERCGPRQGRGGLATGGS